MFMRSGYSAQTRRTAADGDPVVVEEEREGVAEWRSGTQHHHSAAGVIVGGLDLASRLWLKTSDRALAFQLRGVKEIELDEVTLQVRRIADAPVTFDGDLLSHGRHARGLTGVEDTIDAHRLRRWAEATVSAVERLQLGDQRAGEQSAGPKQSVGATKKRSSTNRPTEKLHGLHRSDAQRDALIAGQAQRACVGVDGHNVQILILGPGPGAPTQRVEQITVQVERDDPAPPPCEVQGNTPSARADVEDRTIGMSVGELPPQREIGAVQATLKVVPDDCRGSGAPETLGVSPRPRGLHDHALRASPRDTSSWRRASMAV
jgi:hypothetical protein